MDKSKEVIRRFYKRNASPDVGPPRPSSAPSLSGTSQPFVTQSSSRVDSFPQPSASVEPPRIDRYVLYDSPLASGDPEEDKEEIGAPSIVSFEPKRAAFQPKEPSLPAPPESLIEHVEETRHGSHQNASEASEQVEITPPVRQLTPPPAIYIDANRLTEIFRKPSQRNETTRVSTLDVVGLAPPVSQKPMASPVAPSTGSTSPAQKAVHDACWPDVRGLSPPVFQQPMNTPVMASPAQTPTDQHPMNTPIVGCLPNETSRGAYDISRPTCSLNLVCYRGGSVGCILRQVQTVSSSRFPTKEAFDATMEKNSQLIATDEAFFYELRRLYHDMSGIWRRYLSLKTLTGLRLLSFSPEIRPVPVPLDDLVLQEMYYAYKHPDSIKTETAWIDWVFRLRKKNKRHALEFVEGWNSSRVIIAALLPWLVSCLVGIIWTAMGGDAQTAFTVAGFILTSGTVILALLAFISKIESSGRPSAAAG